MREHLLHHDPAVHARLAEERERALVAEAQLAEVKALVSRWEETQQPVWCRMAAHDVRVALARGAS